MARDRNEAINSYISDMLALEEHIEKALASQVADLDEYPDFQREIRSLHRTVEHHISDLRALSDRRDAGGVAESIKRAGSNILGLAAGAIDLVRSEGLPKNVRDDYTAISLATISYVMLHTTALTLGDREVGDLAHQHLHDYASWVMRIHNIVPAAVVRYFQLEGLPVDESALEEVSRNVESVWRSSAEKDDAPETSSVIGQSGSPGTRGL